ncbi:MAG: thrombospondin type 3 repeat-containing protein [Pseudomonadota bacterium]
MKLKKYVPFCFRSTPTIVASLVFVVALSMTSLATANQPDSLSLSQPELLFEQNKGQFGPGVDYVAKGDGYSVVLGRAPVIELFRYSDLSTASTDQELDEFASNVNIDSIAQLRLTILGARDDAQAIPLAKNQARTHYLLGSKEDWRTDVPNFARIRYDDILPLVDVEYYGQEGRLEYDFIVRPGGDPAPIQFRFDGADDVRLSADGNLIIRIDGKEIVQRAPFTYQRDETGVRQVVASRYVLSDDVIGFELDKWDTSRDLIIDPVLEYSRYFGGARFDRARDVEVDAAGNIYVISDSTSGGLATPGVYLESPVGTRFEQESFPFCVDCTDAPIGGGQVRRVTLVSANNLLITKFSPDGQTVLWSTYFNGAVAGNVSLGVDSTGVSDAGELAFGITSAADGLPLVNPTQTYSGTQNNAYIAKLNSAGSALTFSTYLNLGTITTWVRGLDVSASGEVAATGLLSVGNGFPVVNGLPGQSCIMNAAQNEFFDGYVALFNASGTLTFSSCLGGDIRSGSSIEGLRGVAIGDNGDLYVLGYSSMTDFPVVNAIQPSLNVIGSREMTISQIDPVASVLKFSTYFGPTAANLPPTEFGNFLNFFPIGIKVDSAGNIVVSGPINSLSYPLVNAFQTNLGVPQNSAEFRQGSTEAPLDDTFVTKLHPTNGVIFSTYLGGSQSDGGLPSLALDSEDNIYVAVVTRSDDYPVLNPIQASKTDESSIAVSQFTPDGALAFSTYLGGSNDQVFQLPGGLAVNAAGKIIVGGYTRSVDFPIVGSGTTNAGDYDVTLAIIDPTGDTDTDGDGVPDLADAFPSDAAEWRDTDGDLLGDNADSDDDDDGFSDASDRFPKNASEWLDADEDGAGNNLDQFDGDPGNYFDLDMDGIADFLDTDSDGDGVLAPDDAFDYDASETSDTDFDGVGNNADEDDDSDGFADFLDIEPLNAQSPVQTFERYTPFDVSVFLSPWPTGYSDVVGTDTSWTAATDDAFGGQTSFGSLLIGDNQVAAIEYTDTFAGGAIKFQYKVDSQENFDLFTFLIDGVVVLTASGDTGWQTFETPIASGSRTLQWRYAKDGSISEGADGAWFDDLALDGDGDGATDDVDNCLLIANPAQRDTDGDGYGNFCDADLNNDCVVNFLDLAALSSLFLTTDEDADFNGDGLVNFIDISLFAPFFGLAPGPSTTATCP